MEKIASNTPFSFNPQEKYKFLHLSEDINNINLILLMLEKNWGASNIAQIKSLTTQIQLYPKHTPCYIIGCESTIPEYENINRYQNKERDDAIRALCDEVLARSGTIGVRGKITHKYLTEFLNYNTNSVEIIFEHESPTDSAPIQHFLTKNSLPTELKDCIHKFQISPHIPKDGNSSNKTPQNFLAESFKHLGGRNFLLAADTLRKGLEKFPQDPWLYYHLGHCLLRAGEREKSATAFESALIVSQRKTNEFKNGVSLTKNNRVEIDGITLKIDPTYISPPIQSALIVGGYEKKERELLQKMITPEDSILELGAGLGYLACSATKNQPSIRYTAIEANPHLIPLIKENLTINSCTANVIWGAASNHGGTIDFYMEPNFWASSTIKTDTAHKIETPAINIQEKIDELRPTVLVIDIEGGELDILPHLKLNCVNKIIIEFHPQAYTHQGTNQLITLLISSGFYLDTILSKSQVFVFHKEKAFT